MHGGSVDSQGLHSRRNPRALLWLDGPTWVDGRPSASVDCGKRMQVSTTHDIMESKDDINDSTWVGGDRIGQSAGLWSRFPRRWLGCAPAAPLLTAAVAGQTTARLAGALVSRATIPPLTGLRITVHRYTSRPDSSNTVGPIPLWSGGKSNPQAGPEANATQTRLKWRDGDQGDRRRDQQGHRPSRRRQRLPRSRPVSGAVRYRTPARIAALTR